MSESISGGCLCGEIRYECSHIPDTAYLCHCRNCQKAQSAPYAAASLVPPESITVTKGATRRYEETTDSGNTNYREFCSNCGTQLFAGSVVYPQIMSVRIITLDNPNLVKPTQHAWVKSAVDWVCMNDHLPKHQTQQSMEDFAQQLIEDK